MKATIDELGMLSIKAENPLESYAIQKWADQNMGENGIVDGRNLTICFGKDNYTVETPKKSHYCNSWI